MPDLLGFNEQGQANWAAFLTEEVKKLSRPQSKRAMGNLLRAFIPVVGSPISPKDLVSFLGRASVGADPFLEALLGIEPGVLGAMSAPTSKPKAEEKAPSPSPTPTPAPTGEGAVEGTGSIMGLLGMMDGGAAPQQQSSPEAMQMMARINARVESMAGHPRWKKAARAKYASRLMKLGLDPMTTMMWVEGGSGGFAPMLQAQSRMGGNRSLQGQMRLELLKDMLISERQRRSQEAMGQRMMQTQQGTLLRSLLPLLMKDPNLAKTVAPEAVSGWGPLPNRVTDPVGLLQAVQAQMGAGGGVSPMGGGVDFSAAVQAYKAKHGM